MGVLMDLMAGYGLWIVLIAVFLAMHWFGMSCCGGRREHEASQDGGRSSRGKTEHRRSTTRNGE